MKPKIENSTAISRTCKGSDAGMPVCVPGSKKRPQLIQKLSLNEVLNSSLPWAHLGGIRSRGLHQVDDRQTQYCTGVRCACRAPAPS